MDKKVTTSSFLNDELKSLSRRMPEYFFGGLVAAVGTNMGIGALTQLAINSLGGDLSYSDSMLIANGARAGLAITRFIPVVRRIPVTQHAYKLFKPEYLAFLGGCVATAGADAFARNYLEDRKNGRNGTED